IHLRQEVGGSPPAHYPGNLQGRHFGETGRKGGLAVEVAGGLVNAAFLPLAPVRWERVALGGLAEVSTVDQFLERARSAVERLRGGALDGSGSSGTAWGTSFGDDELLLCLEPEGPCPLY